jgi:hypothetical protein
MGIVPVEDLVHRRGVEDPHQISTQLLQHGAADLGELHVEEDLLGGRRLDVVDDGDLHVLRQRHGLTHHGGVADLTGEDQCAARAGHHDLLVPEQVIELTLQGGDVRGHFQRVHLRASGAAPDHQARRSHLLSIDEELVRGERQGLGDVAVGDGEPANGVGAREHRGGSTGDGDHALGLREKTLLGPGGRYSGHQRRGEHGHAHAAEDGSESSVGSHGRRSHEVISPVRFGGHW